VAQVTLQFRAASVADGAGLWELARQTGLDLNSPYSYLMLGKFFGQTCLVAEEDGRIVGFVSAFRPPQESETIFVWQIGVADSQRGKGVGSALLRELLECEGCRGVRYLAATVTATNLPSQRLFRGVARNLGTSCEVTDCFLEHLFPAGSGHEAERLFRIGPLR
jgi:L-2,4-diaminobutyric acid acetyltransferase